MGWREKLAATLALLILLGAPKVGADSWAPATRAIYLSQQKTARLTVEPRDLSSPLAYFETKLEERSLPGQPPRALLERLEHGRWVRVREFALVNEVSPVSALVSDDAARVVTFDNWHSMGFGGDAVVIYDGEGRVLRSFALTDILPENYVRALPRSVSSLHWSGEHRLEPGRVVLSVAVPSRQPFAAGHDYVDVSIQLETGSVTLPTGAGWERAMAAARPIAMRDRAAEAEYRAFQLSPCTAPENGDGDDWKRYLAQVAPRLEPLATKAFVFSWVLSAPGIAGHEEEAKSIRDVVTGWDGEVVAFAAPAAPDALVQVLTNAAGAAPRGSLRDVHVLVAVPARLFQAVRAALAPTEAQVLVFDPAVAVPQRAEVIQAMGVAPGQADVEAARAEAQARSLKAQAAELDKLAPPLPKPDTPGEEEEVLMAEEVELEEMADKLEAAADMLEQEAEAATGGD